MNCSQSTCSLPSCAAGSHLVTSDGDCCPHCVTPPSCTSGTVVCDTTACPAGGVRTTVADYCCQLCLPTDRCSGEVCPLTTCKVSLTTLRDGDCCRSCSLCLPTEDEKHACDRNENLVCRPGLFSGADCSVTATGGSSFTFRVSIPQTLTNVQDGNDIKYLILSGTSIPRENVKVTAAVVAGNKRQQAQYDVEVSAADSSASQTGPQAQQAAQQGGLTTGSSTSSAAVVHISFMLLFIMLLL